MILQKLRRPLLRNTRLKEGKNDAAAFTQNTGNVSHLNLFMRVNAYNTAQARNHLHLRILNFIIVCYYIWYFVFLQDNISIFSFVVQF